MSCEDKERRLTVEGEDEVYEIDFGQIQIEITDRCNMRCRHCRAGEGGSEDMPVEEAVRILRFARTFSAEHKEVVVSGGEPLMHREFERLLRELKANGCEMLTLTTNGVLLTRDRLLAIREVGLRRVSFSVSLDSLDERDCAAFRGHLRAYPAAVAALELAVRERWPGMFVSMRTTVRPEQVPELPKLVRFARDIGADRISLSGIHPVGRAAVSPELWMAPEVKRRFIESVIALQAEHRGAIAVSTNDPLKCVLVESDDVAGEDEVVLGGCIAAAATFNVMTNGDMTPCALMDLPIMNVRGLSVEEMAERYVASPIVRDMLAMKVRGRCGSCAKRYSCGGCRARAMSRNGHYLEEDPDCWL